MHAAVEVLQRGADRDVALRQELLVGMDLQLDRLHRLLDELARHSAQIMGTLELVRRPVALSEWLPPILAIWREAVQANGLRWQSGIQSNLPTLEADPDQLNQVMGNLISNAIKFTPFGGTVSVDAGVGEHDLWNSSGGQRPGHSTRAAGPRL